MNFAEQIFLATPFWGKRILANIEGIRRNSYRKYGDYNAVLSDVKKRNPLVNGVNNDIILERMNELICYARKNVPYYQNDLYNIKLNTITDLSKLPILTKDDIRKNNKRLCSIESTKYDLYRGATSGSTGTPVSYYTDKESERMSKAYNEAFHYMLFGKSNLRCMRISGVKTVPQSRNKPPFWVYIDVFKQLQCSGFHINSHTAEHYLRAMEQYKIDYGTGYASSWLFLAQFAKNAKMIIPKPKAIFTDSEGISSVEQDLIESVFNCKVYQTYGLSEVCCISIMCHHRNYHIFQDNTFVEIIDEFGHTVENGKEGQIILTDLNSKMHPFIRYETNDIGILGNEPCKCGWKSPYFSKIIGRLDDYFLTEDGRKITRLGFIMRPAKGVLKSQLIQTDYSNLKIRIIPDDDFNSASMLEVEQVAKDILGRNINVNWEIAQSLEQSKVGKTKYLIRKLDQSNQEPMK